MRWSTARMPLRARIVLIFCLSIVLLVGVVAGSLALLWQWNVARLADAERETARARWNLSLEQVASFYEAVAIPLATDADFTTAVDRLDRDAITQRLLVAKATQTDLAPIARIDLIDQDGELIASSRGLGLAAPLADTKRADVALRNGFPVTGPEMDADGRMLLVVTVRGPPGTVLSIGSDLLALLTILANNQQADMFLLDRSGNLIGSTDADFWRRLHASTRIRTNRIFYARDDGSDLIAVPLTLRNSNGETIGTLLSVHDVTLDLQRRRLILLIGGAVTVLLLFGTLYVVYTFTRGALDPLADITRTVRALADGNLFVPVEQRVASSEIASIAGAVEVFRSHAVELDRRQVRETLRDAQQHALIRREMERLAGSLDEPARGEVLSGLNRIEEASEATGGAAALAAGFQLMTGRVTEQHRQVTTLLQERTRDLQIVREALEEREQLGRLREELEFARHLQMASLPAIFPPFPERTEFDIYASMQPAKEVGGDFYDFALLDGERLALVIGDASGKGVSAAMFIATCRALLRSAVVRGATPSEALAVTNAAVASDNQLNMFATVFLAVLDLRSGRLCCANAGHNPPYIIDAAGGVRALDQATGIALGAIEPFDFEQTEVVLAPGDCLFMFTDGVTEAHDPAMHLFGEARLEAILAQRGDRGAGAVIRFVSTQIAAYAAGQDQADDITMLSLVWAGSDTHADHP